MTETASYWHIDTIPEIVNVAAREIKDNASRENATAVAELIQAGRFFPFVDKLTILYLQELVATGEHINGGQLRDEWLAWSGSSDAVHERWYSPVARAATGTLGVLASYYVTLAARDIMPNAQVQLAEQPFDETGEPTHMRPADLVRNTSREYRGQ